MTRHCFTYGSLMCADIMSAVAGSPLAGEPASLADHARHPVAHEDYPGMVAAAGQAVDGVLYRDLPESAWARLDAFEGEQYERRRVRVALADGGEVEAWTYLFRPEFGHRLLPGDWDHAAFLAEGKARFKASYLGFEALGGAA